MFHVVCHSNKIHVTTKLMVGDVVLRSYPFIDLAEAVAEVFEQQLQLQLAPAA